MVSTISRCVAHGVLFMYSLAIKGIKAGLLRETLTKNLLLDGASTLLKHSLKITIFLILELGYLEQTIPKF